MAGDTYKCPNHEAHEWRLRAIEEILKDMPELRDRVMAVEQSSKSAHHRLDGTEKLTNAVMELTLSVKDIAHEVSESVKALNDHGEKIGKQELRIEKLEKAPGDELLDLSKQAKKRTVDLVVAAVVGAVIMLLTLAPQLAALAQKAGG